jgi:hypothetical protein
MTPTASSLYLDGNLYAQVPQSGSNTGFKLRSNIGYFNYAGGKDYFQGFISNFRIYERALSTAEVSQLYASEAATTSNSFPTILTHPTGQNLLVGQPLQLSVTATGAGPLTYQWLRNGSVLTGATTASYTVANATTTDAGTYTALVQNAAGAAYSNPAVLTVVAPSQVLSSGLLTHITFDSSLTRAEPVAVQATLNGGLTNATDRFGRPGFAADFDGIDDSILFTLPDLPRGAASRTLSIWARSTPRANVVLVGLAEWGSAAGRRTFGISAQFAPQVYQAKSYGGGNDLSSTQVADAVWRHLVSTYENGVMRVYVDGVPKGELAIPLDTGPGDLRVGVGVEGGNYFSGQLDDLRIYSRALSAAEVSQLYATEAVTASNSFPTIVTHPAGQSLQMGQPLQLSVTASGAAPLTYQWLRNGTVLTGATTASYAVANATATDAGTYSVLVQNALGSVYTNPATVTVTNPVPTAVAPAITTQPQGRTVDAGTAVTLTVAATGTEPLAYQWLRNGTAVPGATAASLRIASAGPGDAGTYTARVANEQGTALSNPATLVVNQLAVQVTQDPTAPGVGSPVSLTAAVSPAGTYRYQWLRNGQPLAGQTNATLTIAFATPANSGAYACVVTNAAGTSLTSTPRQLQVSTGSPELRIVNSSTRLFVGTGDQVLITGLVLEGSGARSLLVRAVGPGLNPFGVTGTLPDPQLTVYDSARRVVAANDDWTASLGPIMAQAGAFPLPATSRDSALVVSLSAGAYTFMVSGANNSSGTALLEVYELP